MQVQLVLRFLLTIELFRGQREETHTRKGKERVFLMGSVLSPAEFTFQKKASWYFAKMTNISEGIGFEIILMKRA